MKTKLESNKVQSLAALAHLSRHALSKYLETLGEKKSFDVDYKQNNPHCNYSPNYVWNGGNPNANRDNGLTFAYVVNGEVEYFCNSISIKDLPGEYFMGLVNDYRGYIPTEALNKISHIKNFINKSPFKEGISIVICDTKLERFKKYSETKGDPWLAIIVDRDMYIISRWLQEEDLVK